MQRNGLILFAGALLLTGCGRDLSRVGDAAEHARIKTEQMVDAAEAKSNAKQARIFAEAAQMEREEMNRRDGPRFEARKEGAGDNWTIYDTQTGQPARIGTQTQSGLTRQQAAQNLANMQDDDDNAFRR